MSSAIYAHCFNIRILYDLVQNVSVHIQYLWGIKVEHLSNVLRVILLIVMQNILYTMAATDILMKTF